MDCHFNLDEIIIAVDRKRRLLYFIDIDIGIPQFDRTGRIVSYIDGRFKCRSEDITSIRTVEGNNNILTITVNFEENFKMHGFKQKWQFLWMITSMNSEFLEFKKELSSIPFTIKKIQKS